MNGFEEILKGRNQLFKRIQLAQVKARWYDYNAESSCSIEPGFSLTTQ
jgi:hypothetical protein